MREESGCECEPSNVREGLQVQRVIDVTRINCSTVWRKRGQGAEASLILLRCFSCRFLWADLPDGKSKGTSAEGPWISLSVAPADAGNFKIPLTSPQITNRVLFVGTKQLWQPKEHKIKQMFSPWSWGLMATSERMERTSELPSSASCAPEPWASVSPAA